MVSITSPSNPNAAQKARGAGKMGNNGANAASGLMAHEIGHHVQNILGIAQALSTPMPCSPVSEPPASMHASRIASASFCARSAWPCSRAS